jgi:hypothetical protein
MKILKNDSGSTIGGRMGSDSVPLFQYDGERSIIDQFYLHISTEGTMLDNRNLLFAQLDKILI